MGGQLSKEPFIVVYKKTSKRVQKEAAEAAKKQPAKSEDFQDAAKELAKGTHQHCQASPDAKTRLQK